MATGFAIPSQGTSNNGNVVGYYFRDSMNASQSHTAAYSYDKVNRLTSASGSPTGSGTVSYSQNYNYTGDGTSKGPYGNMSCTAGGSGYCPGVSFDASTNRILNIGSASAGYDAAGDMTGDGTNSYQWDAEGRLKSINNGTTASYTYNSLGWRVETHAGTAYHEFVYDPAGAQVGRNDRGSSFFWQYLMMGEQPFGKYQDGKTYFLHSNSLGSTGFVTDQTGATTEDILYYPWGQQWSLAGTNKDQHFAGLWQDPESGLLHTEARKLNTLLGRWMSPDPMGGDITNPQSLNRYAYVLNNPTNFVDPSGLVRCEEFGEADCDCPPDAIDCCDPLSGDPDCPIGGGGPIGGIGGGGGVINTPPPPPPGCTLYGDPMRCAGIDWPPGGGLDEAMGEDFLGIPTALPNGWHISGLSSVFKILVLVRGTLPKTPTAVGSPVPPRKSIHTGKYSDYLLCSVGEDIGGLFGNADKAGQTLAYPIATAVLAANGNSAAYVTGALGIIYFANVFLQSRAVCKQSIYGRVE